MIDVISLLATVNLRDMIQSDSYEKTTKEDRAFCPFCQKKSQHTPAIKIYHNNSYHCFGCGEHGNAIDYVMHRDEVDFLEACRRLGWNGGQVDPEALRQSMMDYNVLKALEEQRNAEELAEYLAKFTEKEQWIAFQKCMKEENRMWWRAQGISDDWQDYLKLGYINDKPYYDRNKKLNHSPAYTIPFFHYGFKFQNMQYRLQDPLNPNDRYRFEAGLKPVYYMTEPEIPIQDQVMICEGAKKAIVTNITYERDNNENVSVIATPSKVDYGGAIEAVKDCGRVWIIPDPDAWNKPIRAAANWQPSPVVMATRIGKAARIVRLPVKVDDGILTMNLNLKKYMKMAIKL